jgi:dTDP-4-dehydrorhamnose reductase
MRLASSADRYFKTFLHYHHPPESSEGNEVFSGDLSDPEQVRQMTDRIDPDIIINSAALADVNCCENNIELSYSINVIAVENIIKFYPRAKLIQISTDYVFSDDEDRGTAPPKPDHQPRPINIYGKHKLEAEEATLAASPNNLVVRVNTLFDHTVRRNFFRFVYDNLTAGEKIRAVSDQISNPIGAPGCARLMIQLVSKNAAGIFHLGGREFISRYDLARKIARFFNLDESLIEPVTTEHLPHRIPRPVHAGLECLDTEKFLQLSMPDPEQDLALIRKEMQRHSA